ncbi:MAG: hypothetical protein KDE46_28025, partial [Caldilineaceae bacterium]|nr:hypothetical protein [Caldilineaceae bacterium]
MNSCTLRTRQWDWRALPRAFHLGLVSAVALMLALALTILITTFGQEGAAYAQTGPQLTVNLALDGNPPSLQPGEIFTQRISLNYT